MFAPDITHAYKEMQKELETILKKHGSIHKKQTKKDRWGERHQFEYTVTKWWKLVAKVGYYWGKQQPVVKISKSVPGLDNFIHNLHQNFNIKRRRYRK